MSKSSPNSYRIPLPSGWGISNFAIHFEGEDLSEATEPFAANIIGQLRTDVRAETALETVMAADLSVLRNSITGLELRKQGSVRINERPCQEFEFTYQDNNERKLQQLTIYLQRDSGVYSVTGVHIAGERFEIVREAIYQVAQDMLLGTKGNPEGTIKT